MFTMAHILSKTEKIKTGADFQIFFQRRSSLSTENIVIIIIEIFKF